MFTFDQETRTFWFNMKAMESEMEFRLVGSLLGLAVYSSVILDVHFPLVVYKKLLRQPIGFQVCPVVKRHELNNDNPRKENPIALSLVQRTKEDTPNICNAAQGGDHAAATFCLLRRWPLSIF